MKIMRLLFRLIDTGAGLICAGGQITGVCLFSSQPAQVIRIFVHFLWAARGPAEWCRGRLI